LALDCDRHTLVNYEEREGFFTTIKKAKLKVENYLETKALKGDIVPVMTIFNLKNNFGWKDKTELDHKSTDGSMTPVGINWIPSGGGDE
jgi:hypothetical protein